jgi:hypothetical protein
MTPSDRMSGKAARTSVIVMRGSMIASLMEGQEEEPENSAPFIKPGKAHAHFRISEKLASPGKQDDVSDGLHA